MSIRVSKKDVRRHLEDLGYENISEDRLHEFVRDLKKLIKYEERKKNRFKDKNVNDEDDDDDVDSAISFSSNEQSNYQVSVRVIADDDDTDAISSSGFQSIRPTTSFIRPRLPISRPKSDPVALYHEYKAIWDRTRFPGDDSTKNLRWSVRERMMGRS